MSNKAKNKRERHKSREHRGRLHPKEDRRSDAVTVAWMLSTIATAIAGVISAVGFGLAQRAASTSPTTMWNVITPLMMFVAVVTGLVVLCITPLVYLFRRVPPPLVITVISVTIAVSPLIALVFLSSRS